MPSYALQANSAAKAQMRIQFSFSLMQKTKKEKDAIKVVFKMIEKFPSSRLVFLETALLFPLYFRTSGISLPVSQTLFNAELQKEGQSS